MWKTVLITNGERLTIDGGRLCVQSQEKVIHIPIQDIYCVLIDNQQAVLSLKLINGLTEAGAHLLLCDEKHLPSTIILPQYLYYRPYGLIKAQLSISKEKKDMLWMEIVAEKINNQCRVLRLCGAPENRYIDIYDLVKLIEPGDPKNIEAIAAKKYFSAMFGTTFRRTDNDVTNAALNYGYTIIRSAVAKSLAVHGFICSVGIHHIGEGNAFNLADDLMEPIRPLVDYWVDYHIDELYELLSSNNKRDLMQLVNEIVEIDDKKVHLRYAIEEYIKSFSTAVQTNVPYKLVLPRVIRFGGRLEDKEGD